MRRDVREGFVAEGEAASVICRVAAAGGGNDEGLQFAGVHVEYDASFRVGPEERARVGDQRFSGAVLFADMRVAIENVIEVITVFELIKLMSIMTVNPRQPFSA